MASTPVETPSPRMFCGECGGSYAVQDLARFGSSYVCVNCKPNYVQRMREGVQPVAGSMAGVRYGGFWIRFLAVCIDGLIIGAVATPIFMLVAFATGMLKASTPDNPFPSVIPVLLLELALMALALLYYAWFTSNKGGTLGKLALGLRVITPDGKTLTMGRAVGRYFAYLLSGLTMYIGYIIAAFDSEKRALHDHICNTRVIFK